MKKQRFTEEQIIGVLQEQEAGAKTADLCRKHGISEAMFYIYGRRCQVNRSSARHCVQLRFQASVPVTAFHSAMARSR